MPGTLDQPSRAEQDLYRRFEADALDWVIGPARPATEAAVGAATWKLIGHEAVPGTARVFTVDHPASTDPSLRQETLVAYELREPTLDSWALAAVATGSAPSPTSP